MITGIIVDTRVWVEVFRGPESDLTVHLKGLLRKRRVAMIGVVLAEILKGIKEKLASSYLVQEVSATPLP
jgi:predicted nucleic acid-binding protein